MMEVVRDQRLDLGPFLHGLERPALDISDHWRCVGAVSFRRPASLPNTPFYDFTPTKKRRPEGRRHHFFTSSHPCSARHSPLTRFTRLPPSSPPHGLRGEPSYAARPCADTPEKPRPSGRGRGGLKTPWQSASGASRACRSGARGRGGHPRS
jgi:hypothetical protein